MEKIILVDGNNLLFRSYYATAYNGNFMKNSKGFPTNALFGFTNMLNKIVSEEKPTKMIVAFDKGKTFRHDKYQSYKDGRIETPLELKQQFPLAKKILDGMGIKWYEIDNYEADDIIGTFANYCNQDDNYDGLIISSDKDLLQLISEHVEMKLLKPKDYVRYSKESFKKEWGIEPVNVIDLKALMGDSSDNIPGVKGIGEKTALKLLEQYKTLDGIYENIDSIKGSVHDKLVQDKENAYMSYDIATIVKNVPMEIDMNDIKYLGPNDGLKSLYRELEFFSMIKEETVNENLEYQLVSDVNMLKTDKPVGLFVELDGTNYHKANVVGIALYNENIQAFIPIDVVLKSSEFLHKLKIYTYDNKKNIVALKWLGIDISQCDFDLMIAAYLLEYNLKDDIAYLARELGADINFLEATYKKKETVDDEIIQNAVRKAKFIYENHDEFVSKIKEKSLDFLMNEVEMPLSVVLADMEYNGFNVSKEVLTDMGDEIKIKLDLISKTIYNYAGIEFNISSPLQLGDVLFERLGLPHGKKGKTGYSTAADVLEKLIDKHPIIPEILNYRMLSKLYTTYIEGLKDAIMKDGKIHTIYMQTLTRTGRLSSIEPNLQNIPIRQEYGRLIRKAFLPSHGIIVSGDYSQIELRLLAHIANIPSLIEAFNNGVDIHLKTASDIFNVPLEGVTKDMRRMAKAVNFGIIYGISSFGLSENLHISTKDAKEFIDNYLNKYPGIQKYMDNTICEAHKDGCVKTMFGRIRTIPELENKNYMIRSGAERMALNTPIQGSSADIIKMAMVKVYKRFQELNLQSKMVVQVHDELVIDCVDTEKDIVMETLKSEMENIVSLSVPLKVDIEYGEDWYQAK